MEKERSILHGALLMALGALPVLLAVILVLSFNQPQVYRCPMFVEGGQMASHSMPAAMAAPEERKLTATEKAAISKKLSATTPAAIELGAGVYARSCVSCHGGDGKGNAKATAELPVAPVALTSWGVQWRKDADLYKTVSNHEYITPMFSEELSAEERWGVVHYIREEFAVNGEPPWKALRGQSSAEVGRVAFKALDCNRCHADDRPRDIAGFPPSLDNIGSKLKRDWIVDYLMKPYPIRWGNMGVRPLLQMAAFKFDRQTAEALADFLETRVDTIRFSESALSGQGDADEGRRLFKSYQCLGCHSLRGKGNKVGPDLTKAGLRLKPAYIFQWVKDPQGLIPGTAMKDFQLWDDEAASLVRYVETLR